MDFNASKITLATGVAITATYAFNAFCFVPKPWNWVVERNLWGGTKVKTWKPGLHFMLIPVPPLMRVANKLYCADLTTIITIGKDDEHYGDPSAVEFSDASAGVTMQLITRIDDPVKATYEVDDYLKASCNLVESTVRRRFSEMKLDNAMSEGKKLAIAEEIFEEIKEIISAWGVIIKSVKIIDFMLPEKIIEQRDKVLVAEKTKTASITEAEGRAAVIKTIAEAEADAVKVKAAAEAKAKVLLATGEGKAEWTKIKSIAQQLKLEPVQVIAWLLNQQLLDAMEASTLIVSTNKEGTMNLPHIDMAATMAAIQQTINNSRNQGE